MRLPFISRRRPAPPARLLRSIARALESLADTEALRLKLELIREDTTVKWLREAEFSPGAPEAGAQQDDAREETPRSVFDPPFPELREPPAVAFNFTGAEQDAILATEPGSLEERLAMEQVQAAHGVEAAAAAPPSLTTRAAARVGAFLARLRGETPAQPTPPAQPASKDELPTTRPLDASPLPFVAEEDPVEVRTQALSAFRRAVRGELDEKKEHERG